MLIYKPQLGLLLPVALVAGRNFRALIAAGRTAAALVLASVLLFEAEIWAGYFHNVSVLRQLVLEDGTGVWHRMLSVFVAARRLGADVPTAYAVQITVALAVAGVVALAWFRDSPAPAKNAVLVLGSFLATPYLQDYGLVIGVFVTVWLAELYPAAAMPKPAAIGAGLILVVLFVAAALANLTGYAFGPLFIMPAFVIVAQIAVAS